MVKIHNLGFPRMGDQRELKFALERYFRGEIDEAALAGEASDLRAKNWQRQATLDFVPLGDDSLYDHVLDTSFLLGNVPERARRGGTWLDTYFRAARGRAPGDSSGVAASEMTKWFDTNYHYIVPELSSGARFSLDSKRLLAALEQAKALGHHAKPVLLGPVSYLLLGKTGGDFSALDLLPEVLSVYRQLLSELARAGVEWVQIDEPILATDLPPGAESSVRRTYRELGVCGVKVLLATYFGELRDNLELLAALPVHGVHLDVVRAGNELPRALELLSESQVLSLGVVDGRNVWRADLTGLLDLLDPIAQQKGERLWLAPSCSLIHVPVDLDLEKGLDPDVRPWLAFAVQKLEELRTLRSGLNQGRGAVAQALEESRQALESRRTSPRVHRHEVSAATGALGEGTIQRESLFPVRQAKQRGRLKLPLLPTTTIGSFPQTAEIRRTRRRHRNGELDDAEYERLMRRQIADVVREQEALGLDVLVHGEPERNDMVEYFGERLEGFAISDQGWVQSYGSRCVKPPILFGDVLREKAMTVPWIRYAQALTHKPMKGMLTGPVTILNWSFVRDDQPRATSCEQIALAIRQEVSELESEGIGVIQIDEAALREGLPLRKGDWAAYLSWAVRCFRISSSSVRDETQIHTHMCYSEFNDIIGAISELDADVITIENSRSHGELLRAFDAFDYQQQIGPGVYDIHAPNVPTADEMASLVRAASEKIPIERLWINPDCGLKTRSWDEVRPALRNMVSAARLLREELGEATRLSG